MRAIFLFWMLEVLFYNLKIALFSLKRGLHDDVPFFLCYAYCVFALQSVYSLLGVFPYIGGLLISVLLILGIQKLEGSVAKLSCTWVPQIVAKHTML